MSESLLPPGWQVHLPVFEGPLDLLLHLVKVNQVEITDIPVATICDQFHEYLRLMEELNLDIAGEYIYEASLLIHLKSKMLLPRPATVEGRAGGGPAPGAGRAPAGVPAPQGGGADAGRDRPPAARASSPGSRSRGPGPEEGEEIELGEVSLFDLLGAFKQVLVRYDREHPPPFLVSPRGVERARRSSSATSASCRPAAPSTSSPTSAAAPAAPRRSPPSSRSWSWRG